MKHSVQSEWRRDTRQPIHASYNLLSAVITNARYRTAMSQCMRVTQRRNFDGRTATPRANRQPL